MIEVSEMNGKWKYCNGNPAHRNPKDAYEIVLNSDSNQTHTVVLCSECLKELVIKSIEVMIGGKDASVDS